MLTKKQKKLYEYLAEYIDKNSGISPSFEEMKNALGLKSKSGIHRLINSLEQRGAIKRLKHKARALELIDKEQNSLLDGKNNEISIPLLGLIPAGNSEEAINSSNETIKVPSNLISNKYKYFGLQVKGESMIGEGILDGDVAIVKQSKEILNGKIGAILIKGETVTLKKVKIQDSYIKLIPANPAYEEKVYSPKNIEIQGVLAGIIRKYN